MADQTVDGVARAVAAAPSRRRALAILLGLALGGATPLAGYGKKGRCYKKWCDAKYPCCKRSHRCVKPSPLMPGPHCLKP